MNKLVLVSKPKIKGAFALHTRDQVPTCTLDVLLMHTRDLVEKGHILQSGSDVCSTQIFKVLLLELVWISKIARNRAKTM